MSTNTASTERSAPPPTHEDAVSAENASGLSEAEAKRRLAQYGENALVEHRVSLLERLARFFWGPIPWMIEIAAVLSGDASPLG